ncbi:TonB-dependent receptor [Altererythrobacter sp. H2]|uniref:TonB-dependent receptor n=1 Tax=Altererythrobacter sp. H2 TaxID=3108391 RepID=UPI002B4BDA21|nr:TonB-dependent receptor [Altererythrobacter sp. H2]WRK96128.1 TonB-dependent receptor [Altererythrobacter sp. H2]
MPSRITLVAALPALALPIVFAAPLAAQEQPAEPAEVIVVTGRGLPEPPASPAYGAVDIARETLVSAPSGRIEEVLGGVAGFQQFRRSDSRSANPSAQGITLRALGGNASSRALVLLDGVPMADPFFGYIPLSALAPERLGSVRVTRGGGSGPFGAGALAGTIELTSADAAALGPVSASLLANDRGETEASGTVATALGAGFVTLGGRWDRGEGFFTTPDDQRVAASVPAAFDAWSARLRAVAPLTPDIELQASGLLFRDDRTLRFAGADSMSEGQDASVRLVGRGAWQFDALAYVQARNFANVVISSTRFTRTLDQRNTPSTGLGGKLELRPPVGPDHVLRLGVDYRRSSGELQEEAYNAFSGAQTERRRAGGVTSDLGLFAEHDWRIGALVLTGGVRADRSVIADGFYRAVTPAGAVVSETIAPDRSDWTVTWRGGAAWQASDALRLRAAAYRGLRLPALNELYRPFVVFPVVTQANADLRNERLLGFEAGFDLRPAQGVSLGLTLFDNEVEDAIANVTLAPNLRQRQNLPAIRARGVEATLSATRGAIGFEGALAWTDAEVLGEGASLPLDGFRPAQTPRLAGSVAVAWKPAPGWLLSATLRHVGAQFEDDLESDVLPAATTLGAYAQVPLTQKLALVLRGENLTDETVVTRNSGGSVDLGTPRTLWAGLRWGY